MNKTVLITGGSGLIGSKLSEFLLTRGYFVKHLSRSKTGKEKFKTYKWNIEEGLIENEALESADYIIHLAGANIAAKRWTRKRKKKLLESRTKSSELLYKKLSEVNHKIKAVVSASGVSIYGVDTGDKLLMENSDYGNDFIAVLTQKWETSVEQIEELKIRVVRLRIGIVLTLEGGALPKLMGPIKYGIGAPLGSGNQIYSWIHIQDLCRVFLEAIENEKMMGPYNTVAPNPVTNKELNKIIASKLKRPLIFPNIPAFILKILFGELANLVLGGNKVSPKKLKAEGFKFIFDDFGAAIEDLILKKKPFGTHT